MTIIVYDWKIVFLYAVAAGLGWHGAELILYESAAMLRALLL